MKKVLYTIALVVIGFTASYAQKPGRTHEKLKGTPEQRAEKAATAMQQKLSLSNDQKAKVMQLELDRIKKNDEWRNQDHDAMKGKAAERKAFMKDNKDKMDAILTVEQQKTLETSRNEMRNKMKDRKDVKGPKGPKGSKKGNSPPPPAIKSN